MLSIIDKLKELKNIVVKHFSAFSILLAELYTYISRVCSDFAKTVVYYQEEIILSVYCSLSFLFLLYNFYFAIFAGMVFLVCSVNKKIKLDRKTLLNDPNQLILVNEVKEKNVMALEWLARSVYLMSIKDEDNANILKAGVFSIAKNIYSNIAFIKDLQKSGLHILFAESKDSPNHLTIAIRGTDLTNLDGMFENDFDDQGTAYSLFNRHAEVIIRALEEKVETGVDTLQITGHSAGGSVSMLLLWKVLEKISEDRESHGQAIFSNLKIIRVAVFQSAGVNDMVCERVNELLDSLSDTNLKVDFISCVHDYDPVSDSGRQILGDYHGSNADIYLVRKHINIWTFILQVFKLQLFFSHSLSFFIENPDPSVSVFEKYVNKDSIMEYFSDETEKGRENISHVFNSAHTKIFCNGRIHRLVQWIGSKGFGVLFSLVSLILMLYTLFYSLAAFYMLPSAITFGTVYYFIPQAVESLAEFYLVNEPFLVSTYQSIKEFFVVESKSDIQSDSLGESPMGVNWHQCHTDKTKTSSMFCF